MRHISIILLAAGLALCQPAVFAHASTAKPVAGAKSASVKASGKLQLHIFESPNLHCNDTVAVYSPQTKKARKAVEKNIPTVFLLHGYSGCYRDWANGMDIQELSNRTGFRIICPDGFFDSWYLDKTDASQMKWRVFFWEELWPALDAAYGLDPSCTFITGLSMGGHGAMNIFLDHPELFRGAGSMSGVLNLRNSGGSRTLIPQMIGASDIEDPLCDAQSAVNRLERVKERCPDYVIQREDGSIDKILVVTCGEQDKTFLPASREFEARCNELGLYCAALYTPARHRWPYWTWVVNYHLSLFQDCLVGSCLGFTRK